jgi:hypothetical protein
MAVSSRLYSGAADLDRALQARGARGEQLLRPPDRQHGVLHDQRNAEGRQQLEDLRRGVDPPQHDEFDHHPDRGHRKRRDEEAAKERQRRRRQRGRHSDRDVGAEHVERAVREIDDPRDAEDQRQPCADEEQRRTVRESREELAEDEVQGLGAVRPGRSGWP